VRVGRMQGSTAAAGSTVFFFLAPGIVAGLVPWLISSWEVRWPRSAPAVVVMTVGAVLLIVAIVVLVRAFARFVIEGRGTPAPVAPTERLVVGGEYRFVRNPMYVAVVGAVLAQAMIFGSLPLLGYAAIVWAIMAAFVHWYEEPALLTSYGDEYQRYRQAVPAWLPRLRPWRPDREPGNKAA
jgi:protein-S-isoprenylcysteine O-methyltransferase Ste14